MSDPRGAATSPEPLLLDLGLRLSVQCGAPGLGQIISEELGDLVVPALGGDVQIKAQLRGLDEQVNEGSLAVDEKGWSLTTWGVRMRLDLGAPGEPSRLVAEVSHADPLSLHLALQDALYLLAPHHGGLLLHAAAVLVSGAAFLLSGDKDAGKTTACRNAPAGVQVMGDEGIVCLPGADGSGAPDGWRAHATPFHSDDYTFTATPGGRPLEALVQIIRGAPGIRAVAAGEALWPLMRSSGRLGGPSSEALFELMTRLVREVPCYELSSNRPEQVWPLLGEIT